VVEPRKDGADHGRHDALLVAAYSAGDLMAGERQRAESLVAGCAACATLVADLRAIRSATSAASLPVAPRPRSFLLRPEDAGRLRPRGWRRVLQLSSSPRWAVTRPLAAGLTTVGLAGLLVGAIPMGLPSAGSGASPTWDRAAAPTDAAASVEVASPDALPAASAPPEVQPGLLASPAEIGVYATSGPSARPTTRTQAMPTAAAASPAPGSAGGPTIGESAGPSPLAVVSALVLALGLGLFALRRVVGSARTA